MLLPQWWEARISRQKETEVSMAAKAVFESFQLISSGRSRRCLISALLMMRSL